MTTPIENTLHANTTSTKTILIMLILAVIGAQLSNIGEVLGILASLSLSPGNSDSSIFSVFPYDPVGGIIYEGIAFLLIFASFLLVSLYPKHGLQQFTAGLLGIISFVIVVVVSYPIVHALHIDPFLPPMLETGIVVAVSVSLLVSKRINNWMSLIGLGFGLLVGIVLWATPLYPSSYFAFSPIWLNAVFFSELFSRRLGWGSAVIGILLWAGLLGLEIIIIH